MINQNLFRSGIYAWPVSNGLPEVGNSGMSQKKIAFNGPGYYLSGGFNQPLWKIWKSDWIIIPTIGDNKKCSKPPTSYNRGMVHWYLGVQALHLQLVFLSTNDLKW